MQNDPSLTPSELEFDPSAICAKGGDREPLGQHAAAEPISLSAVWQADSPKEANDLLSGDIPGFAYRRDGHPNAKSCADLLGRLHCAEKTIITAQGMSSLATVAMAALQPGDSVVIGQPVYGRSTVLLKTELKRWGIHVHDIPATDLAAWKSAIAHKPRLALVETITNPRMEVPDLKAIAELVHHDGGLLLVDNTFATPLLCQPLRHGADLVMESLSKLVCGHSDAMAGLLCGTEAAWDRIESTVSSFGLASSPLDCWLIQRGAATLPVRLRAASENAIELAKFLESHENVVRVDYPGLASHPQHAVAAKQFQSGFGNMLAFHLHERVDETEFISALAPSVPFFPSLGETQTSISHPCSTSHRSYSTSELDRLGITKRTIRVSVGIESTNHVVESFRVALEA